VTSALAEQLRTALGVAAVENVAPLSGGASRETWAFDAVHEDGTREELVLRRDPPGRPSEPGSMAREARTIGAASAAGLAVPGVLALAEDASQWGSAGLVMRRIAGETLARRILRNDAYAHARAVLVSQLGHFAAGLHAISADFDLPNPDPLDVVRSMLDEVEDSSAVFDLALAHLEANRPPVRRPVIVHGDLRLGNVIVGADGLRAVLDWELVHAGSPAEDLGWLCVRAWRFGAEPAVAGLGTRAELLSAYRDAGGTDIDEDELRWWELYGTLRWGAICMWQAQAHLSGALRSVELAAIGRRVSEQEWDLLATLEPQAVERAVGNPPGRSARPATHAYRNEHGRPTAAELLEAVREFLSNDAMPALPSELAFRARVAANAVGIVERELALGDVPAPADDSVDELARHVLAKLLVANPRYVTHS